MLGCDRLHVFELRIIRTHLCYLYHYLTAVVCPQRELSSLELSEGRKLATTVDALQQRLNSEKAEAIASVKQVCCLYSYRLRRCEWDLLCICQHYEALLQSSSQSSSQAVQSLESRISDLSSQLDAAKASAAVRRSRCGSRHELDWVLCCVRLRGKAMRSSLMMREGMVKRS